MICSDCRETKRVPTHTTDLTIGTVESLSSTVYAFVQNLSTGYTHRQEVLTDASGTVVLDMSLPHYSYYHEHSAYKVWVTDTNSVILPVTIDNEINDCFTVSFKDLYQITAGVEDGVEYVEYELVLKEC